MTNPNYFSKFKGLAVIIFLLLFPTACKNEPGENILLKEMLQGMWVYNSLPTYYQGPFGPLLVSSEFEFKDNLINWKDSIIQADPDLPGDTLIRIFFGFQSVEYLFRDNLNRPELTSISQAKDWIHLTGNLGNFVIKYYRYSQGNLISEGNFYPIYNSPACLVGAAAYGPIEFIDANQISTYNFNITLNYSRKQ